jgi:hypothetical protein
VKNGMLGGYKVKSDGKIKYEIDPELIRLEASTLAEEIAMIDEQEMIRNMLQLHPGITRRWYKILVRVRRENIQSRLNVRYLIRKGRK